MSPSKQVYALIALFGAVGTFAAPTPTLVARAPPAQFTANANVGPGGGTFTDSAHFRVYGQTGSTAQSALNQLEAAYKCFVDDLGWRSSGLSYNDNTDADGPWYKVNVYSVGTLPGAAGVMHGDAATGLSWLEVQNSYITNPGVIVHEFGHGLTYHAKNWVDQGRTGAWWETVANWVADTYKTSPLCAAARSQYSQPEGSTEINLSKIIGNSFQVLVDGTAGSGNYYEAWPFFTYLHTNLDNFSGLGSAALKNMWAQYALRSNDTPLHNLARITGSTTVQRIVGRYWARMAYVDIGHAQGQQRFLSTRGSINFANFDSTGSGTYRVKSARQPRYMGANITPLKFSGSVTVTARVTATNGAFTATLVARNTSSGATRYVDLASGSGSIAVTSGEEASLVVANTPAALIQYDPFAIPSNVNAGLDYSVTLTNATF